MKPQPRGPALLRCMSPVAAEADIRALGGSSGFDPSLSLAANFAVTHNKAAYDVVGCDPRPEAHMKRREFITLLGGAAATWPRAAGAQQPAKSYRVAYLALLAGQDATIVKQRLTELGYSVGKNLVFDLRSAEGQSDRLPQVAADLVKTNPDWNATGVLDNQTLTSLGISSNGQNATGQRPSTTLEEHPSNASEQNSR
jgi:hypothetical protein